MHRGRLAGLGLALLLACGVAAPDGPAAVHAASFVAPPRDLGVVGALRTVIARDGETLVDVARRHRLGQAAVRLANPALLRTLPIGGEAVRLPTRHVLPAAPREGLVINLSERRLYRYRSGRVTTYPVSVGRLDWRTPLGVARVIGRRADPDWTPPASIRAEAAAAGRTLPAVVPAGPDNPLGRHALYLDWPGYLLHGTNDPDRIGLAVTHGCLRLYPEDIAELYRSVPDGTPVRIVDEPVKLGRHAGALFIEVHPPQDPSWWTDGALYDTALRLVADALEDSPGERVPSHRIRWAVERRDGVPVALTGTAPARDVRRARTVPGR